MLDILFSHSYYYPLDKKQWENKTPYPPLGTIYAASLMRENDFSVSLFDTNLRNNPFDIEMKSYEDDALVLNKVDMIETFNYLLGLKVTTVSIKKGILEVVGVNNADEAILILWRDVSITSNNALDEWFSKQGYSSRDLEFDLIYVNGDNNLPNLRTGEESWKVQLIEEAFHTLMFDAKDV